MISRSRRLRCGHTNSKASRGDTQSECFHYVLQKSRPNAPIAGRFSLTIWPELIIAGPNGATAYNPATNVN